MNKIFILFLSLCFTSTIFSKSVKDGYEALKIYNYFEAKRIFEKNLKKQLSPCAFGLATIYYRKDNPFHQIDSAYKYVLLASENYFKTSEKVRIDLEKYQFSELNILDLKRNVSSLFFALVLKENTVESYQYFMDKHPWANERYIAIHKRDSLAFQKAVKENTIIGLKRFLQTYPESEYKLKTEFLIEQKTYLEATVNKTLEEFIGFIEDHPQSSFKKEAENEIFVMQTKDNTIYSFYQFIKNFPSNTNVRQAWKKLFQTYMYNYSESRLNSFMQEYPEYPFKEDIERELSNTRAKVFPYRKDKLYGLMNLAGESLVYPIYDWINPYKEGLAMASKNGKVGFIDKENQTIIPFVYDRAMDFEDGRAIVTKGELSGIVDRSGNIIFEPIYKEIGQFSEGLVYAKKDSLFAYYNQYGIQVIQERFTEAFSFQNDLALVLIDEYENYIDRFGNLIFPLKYQRMNRLSENLFVFQEDQNYGLIGKDLLVIKEAKYADISILSENKIAFLQDGKVGYFDQFGNIDILPVFEEYPGFLKAGNFKNGLAKVKFKNKFGVIDANGKWVIPAVYQNLGEVAELIPFFKGLLWGYINLQNKVVLEPAYEEAKAFEDQRAIISFSNKFGLIDNKGTIIIPVEFDQVKKITKEIYSCQQNGLKKIISSENEVLSQLLYSNIFQVDKDLLILIGEHDLHYFIISEKKLIRPL